MKNCIKQEAMYAIKRQYVLILTIVFLLFIVIPLRSNYSGATDSITEFVHGQERCIANGIDWKEEMKKEYSVEVSGEGTNTSMMIIDNPIAYEAANAREALYAISPEFSLTFILESIMGIGFIVVMMLAVVIATYDNKNYTMRFKSTQYSKEQIFVSKQVVLFAVIAISSFISIFISYIGNRIYYNYYIKNVTIPDGLGKGEFSANSNMVAKILVFFALMVFIAELGYAIGIILKSGVAALIAVFAFNIVTTYLPAELRITDSTAKVMQSVFEYYGEAITPAYTAIESTKTAIVYMIIQIICFVSVSFIIFKKRSAYK